MAKKAAARSPKKTKAPRPAARSGAKAAARKPAAKKLTARKKVRLPRPTVTGEELLYLLFKEDYPARQVFAYLRVNTVQELEQFGPEEIFERLTRPLRESVESIRRKLADKNRYLARDERFLLDYRAKARSR